MIWLLKFKLVRWQWLVDDDDGEASRELGVDSSSQWQCKQASRQAGRQAGRAMDEGNKTDR